MYISSFDGQLPEPKMKNPDKWDGRQLLSIIFPNSIKSFEKSYKNAPSINIKNIAIMTNNIVIESIFFMIHFSFLISLSPPKTIEAHFL